MTLFFLYLRRFQGSEARRPLGRPDRGGGERSPECRGTSRDRDRPAGRRAGAGGFRHRDPDHRDGSHRVSQTDSGTDPMGGWQSHQRGHSLSKSVQGPARRSGSYAPTQPEPGRPPTRLPRMTDGLAQWGGSRHRQSPRRVPGCATPGPDAGPGRATSTLGVSATYQRDGEKLERMGEVGDRPAVAGEIDRCLPQPVGGEARSHVADASRLMYFETPQSACAQVLARFHGWRRIARKPDHRATQSARSARATGRTATTPASSYHTEEVVVRIRRGGGTALGPTATGHQVNVRRPTR